MRSRGWSDFSLDQFVEQGDLAAAALSWQATPDEARHQLGHVLRLRNGRIIDIQGYADPAKALRRVRA